MRDFDAKDALNIALTALALFVAYELYKAVTGAGKVVGAALSNTGNAVGNALYDWINPNEYDSYLFSTQNGRAVVTQVIRRSDAAIFSVDALTQTLTPTGQYGN